MADTNLLVLAREYKKLREEVKKVLSMPKGDKGDQGEKGEKGDTGDTGPQGFPGRDGKDGINGYDGKDGLNGNDGKDGKDGLDGVGVQNAYIDFDNSLVIVLTDGREVNAGYLSQETKDNVVATFKQGAATINELLTGPITVPVEISVNSTSPALKLTQTGTGPALLAEDSASPDATPTVIDQFGNLILGKGSRSYTVNSKVEIHSTSESFINPSIGLYNSSNTSTDESNITFRHDKSGIQDPGDNLGRINFLTTTGGGGINAKVDTFSEGIDLFYTASTHQFIGPITSTRINPRVLSTTSTATLTPNISAYDQYNLTAQAAGLTIAAPIGTPVDGNKLIIRILDNGTPRTITWNSTYTPIGMTLPTTTTANKIMYVGCIYNSANNRWDVIALTVQT